MSAEASTVGFDIDDHSVEELRELLSDDAVAILAVPQLLTKIERQNATIRNLFAEVLRNVAHSCDRPTKEVIDASSEHRSPGAAA